MSENWKPGDLDVAQIAWTSTNGRHGGNGLALRCSHAYDESHWRTQTFGIIPDGWVTAVRRLVVIDPEDREQVERLHAHREEAIAREIARVGHARTVDALQAALREFANPTPPKPEEPTGLGAVVEDAEGGRWVRHEGFIAPWHRSDGQPAERAWRYYTDINSVRVLSEGVTND